MAAYHVSRVVSVRLPAKQICQWGSARVRFPMKLSAATGRRADWVSHDIKRKFCCGESCVK